MNKLCKMTLLRLLPLTLASTTAFAGSLSMANLPQEPSIHPVWDIGIHALYLKTSYTDGLAYLDDTTIAPNTDRRNATKLKWGWGFKLEGSYHYCNSDINLNWYHYKKSSSGTFVFRTNPIADTYSITPEWNAVNLEFGETIHFDMTKDIRVHGGLQYAQIKTKYHGNGVDPFAGPGSEDFKLKYTGLGPRVGADVSVGFLQEGLAAYFGGDAALLVGKTKFNFNENFGEPFTVSGSRNTSVVPELGLKLGIRYNYALSCSHLLFDAGYMVVNYFTPLHLSDNFSESESNFALSGFFVGVKWLV